ncbi:unnamed protein product [Closterium sp. NIES-65]|nr:unnamed protein product [Closterium sp. NIES-65]
MATTTHAPSLRVSRFSATLHHSTAASSRLSSRLRRCPVSPLSRAPLSATVPRASQLRARLLRGPVRASGGSSGRTAKDPSDDDDVAAAFSSRTNASSLGPSGEEQGVGSGEIDSRGERDPWGRGEPLGEREPLGETYRRGGREQQRGNAGEWVSSSGEWRLSTGGTSSSQGLDYDIDPLSSKSGFRYNYHTGDEDPEGSIDAAKSYPPSPRSAIPPLPLPRIPPTTRSPPPQPHQSSPPLPRSPPPPPPPPPQIPLPPPRSSNPFAAVSKFALAGVFLLGIGAGVSVDTVLNVEPSNVASREVIDRQTPNPDICLANGMSAMVLDQRLFISFNPFNVYVSQAEVKPGCVLRQSNWHVLESKGLVSSDEVRDCKRNMNTFGFVGDLRESPEVSCVYHSETAENLFLEDASKSKIRIGGSQ